MRAVPEVLYGLDVGVLLVRVGADDERLAPALAPAVLGAATNDDSL